MTLEPTITTLKQAVAYLRVSTDEQTCDNQKLEIEQFAKQNGFTVKKFYQDHGTSGKTDPAKRKGFSAMMQYVQSNPIDAIIVYSISRIGRDMLTTLETIRQTEKIAPIVPIAASERMLQTLDPTFRSFMLAVFGFVAEIERKMISERTKAGLARAKAQGIRIGPPEKPITDADMLRVLEYLKQPKPASSRQKMDDAAKIVGLSFPTLYIRLAKAGYMDKSKITKIDADKFLDLVSTGALSRDIMKAFAISRLDLDYTFHKLNIKRSFRLCIVRHRPHMTILRYRKYRKLRI